MHLNSCTMAHDRCTLLLCSCACVFTGNYTANKLQSWCNYKPSIFHRPDHQSGLWSLPYQRNWIFATESKKGPSWSLVFVQQTKPSSFLVRWWMVISLACFFYKCKQSPVTCQSGHISRLGYSWWGPSASCCTLLTWKLTSTLSKWWTTVASGKYVQQKVTTRSIWSSLLNGLRTIWWRSMWTRPRRW